MSWFDKLFSDGDDEEVYQRKYSQRRQKLEEKERHRQSLLPENNDIYNRPKGNFRFPMHVNNTENTEGDFDSADSDSQISHAEENAYAANQQQDNRRHRRRRNFDTSGNQDENTFRSSRSTRTQNNHQHHHSPKETSYTSSKRRVQNYTSSYDTKEIYYRSGEFKAEEVPSAIFGTKKRHPLENGVIKSDGTIKNEEADERQERIPTDPLNGARRQDKLNTTSQPSSSQNEGTETSHFEKPDEIQHTMKETPNYSSTDNTININNIYASQIVEEIRRERERKFLKRKKFKEALQQKREQEDTGSIQQAIDDMYAKQAKQYVEEPVFNEERPVEVNEDKDEHIDSDKVQDATEAAASKNDHEAEPDLNPDFDYEEINLDDVQQVQSVDDKDVEIVNDYAAPQEDETASGIENIKNRTEPIEHTSEPLKHAEPEISEAQYTEVQTEGPEKEENNETSDYNEDEAAAEPANVNDSTDKNPETSQKQNAVEEPQLKPETESEDFADDKAAPETESISNATKNNSESLEPKLEPTQEKTFNVNEKPDSTTSSEKQDANEQSLEPKLSPENESASSPAKKQEDTAAPNELSDQPSSETEPAELQDNKENKEASPVKVEAVPEKKRPIRKGAKPVNVMMTPSDKRRMQKAQKNKAISATKSDTEKVNHPVQNEPDKNNKSTQEYTSSEVDNTQAHAQSVSSESHANPENNEGPSINEQETQNEAGHITQNVNQLHVSENKANETVSETQRFHQPQVSDSKKVSNAENITNSQQEGIRKGPNLKLPSIDLLDTPEIHEIDEEWIEEKKQELNDAFYYFNVPAEVKNVTEGPSVTRFELSVEKGVKVSRITALQDDLKMALAAKDIRIEAPIPGTSLVGIEVPNVSPTKVNLRSIIESSKFKNAESKLTVAMGNRINNEPLLMDIAKTPHALIAGATGSGKSVAINSMLLSLLYKNHPEELKLLLIDPKMVELAPYNGLPHLVSPVITDVKAATQSLKWAVDEMEKRYKLFAQYHVRNITAFNKKAPYDQRLPKIVIVIDELADLMMMAPQEVEQSIARIAQKARACGIHMLVATQRPSVNVITGLIKANIPTRIAFMVSSSVDSRTILDSGGAERLLGYGDMLYLGNGMNKPIRVQGSFVSDDEIDAVVDYIKAQRQPEYLFEEKELLKQTKAQSKDDLFDEVCRFMVSEGNISTSLIQRHFQIGYNRAARIVDQLEELGYISGSNGSKPREVYLTSAELNEE